MTELTQGAESSQITGQHGAASLTANRRHYIDNLRAFSIQMIVVYHVCMIYNNWGESWYIHGQELVFPSIYIGFCSVWMMPLLFAIAGISSRYALEKRSAGAYAKERVQKLLVPLVFGMLLIVPIQSYLAGLFFNGQASYFDYFTTVTDMSGYDGAWTTGHLWFILFLVVFSLVCLPFMVLYKNKGKGTLGDRIPLVVILVMGLLPCIGSHIDIGGKSPGEYVSFFLLGYFFLANDNVLKKLDRYRFLLLGLAIVALLVSLYFDGQFFEEVSWLSILALLGMGRRYLDFSNKVTSYLSKSCFGVYVFHQSWIVVVAFFIFKLNDNPVLQFPLILVSAVLLTYATYELCRRIPVVRWMFGLHKK